MKQSNNKTARREGFTLGEVMISAGIFGIVSIAVASLSLNGTILFAKNTAENLAHDQNRIAISRLVRDIHAAISTPQLGRIVQERWPRTWPPTRRSRKTAPGRRMAPT